MRKKNDYIIQIDKNIGNKLCDLRIKHNMSRTKLGKLIDVSSQQIGKYENGVNGLSVGRLLMIAKIFNIDISYFYQNFIIKPSVLKERESLCFQVTNNFMKIQNPEVQKSINVLIKLLANL